jgi:outer membrane protein assembly factor BamB
LRRTRALHPHRTIAVVALATTTILGAPVAALAAWPQFQGRGEHDGISDGPAAPLAIAWRNRDIILEGANTSGGLSAPVVADDGTIVTVAPTAVLGFSSTDGSPTFTADRDFGPSSQPAIAEGPDGPIVVFTEGYGDNPPTGSATPSPSPSGDGGGFDSHVNAVALGTGDAVWRSPVQLEDVVTAPVAVDARSAYVSDLGGTVTAVNLDDGSVRWTADLGTATVSAVTVDGEQVLAATFGDRDVPAAIVALGADDGKERWRGTADDVSNIVSSPVLADGRIFVLDALGGIAAFHADGGKELWRTEVRDPLASGGVFPAQGVLATAPVSADGQVFAVDGSGRVFALDAETGAVRWDFALNDAAPGAPPLLTDRQVLVATNSGVLYAVDRRSGHLAWRTSPAGLGLRGLADAGDLLVAVAELSDPEVVAFEADPGGVLLDEPSPTEFDLGQLLAGFALGGLTTAAAALLIARPLHRRLGPSSVPVAEAELEDGR